MSKILFEIKNLKKNFGKGDAKVEAIKPLNLTINEGEFIAILGPSGCGKTTLLNIICGLTPANDGSLMFENKNILNARNQEISEYRNTQVGYIMQNFGLIDSLKIKHNVLLPIKNRIQRKKQESEAIELLNTLGIKSKANAKPHELSGGQKQRVAIARALINKPKIILADEPTGALDQENSQMIMNVLKNINKNGTTILLVTHEESLTQQCSRIIKMEDGQIWSDESLI